jgi:hypothetical protein
LSAINLYSGNSAFIPSGSTLNIPSGYVTCPDFSNELFPVAGAPPKKKEVPKLVEP